MGKLIWITQHDGWALKPKGNENTYFGYGIIRPMPKDESVCYRAWKEYGEAEQGSTALGDYATLEEAKNAITKTQSEKQEFYGWVKLETDDSGQALFTDGCFQTPDGADVEMYVTLGSWDTTLKHTMIKPFDNRRVKITVETID